MAKYEEYFLLAAEVAKKATCDRAKCGSVIISKKREIIGEGFNSPPGDLLSQKRCQCDKKSYNQKVTDKTCCIHAEQRAIMDALRRSPEKIAGSTLYFTRINDHGGIIKSGQPYCTICSKMALDSGVKYFALWHASGIKIYPTDEYNELSYQYNENS